MNAQEKANHEKLLKDLSSENLSDEEIVAMWRAPVFQMVREGFSKYKIQYFLTDKGVSREHAPVAAEQLIHEAMQQSHTNETTASLLTSILQRMTSWFRW